MNDRSGRPLVVVGAGGHAAEVLSYLSGGAGERFHVIAVVDEKLSVSPFPGVPLWRSLAELAAMATAEEQMPGYLVAVGENAGRAALVRRVEALGVPGLRPVSVFAGSAYVGTPVEVGEGTLLAPGALVTTRSRVGRHCILNVKASVAHDCEIGDFVNLNPAATICGWARIGEGAFIGAGATVIDRVSVGAWTVLGAGAVAVRDLPAGVVAVGVPARPIGNVEMTPA